jgi:GNAT superfamily N-acetyltransferase
MRGDVVPQDGLRDLGSVIEVFPGRNDAGRKRRLTGAWRSAPVPGSGTVAVRASRLEDYAAIRALQREAHPDMAPWTLKQFESQRHAFPQGQLVAECDGEVVGALGTLVVVWDDYALEHTWKSVTAEGYFTTHDTAGRTLYVAESVVDLTRRGAGVARALFQAERRLCRKLNLRRIISAVPLAGYHAAKDQMSPELYAKRVIWGDIVDATLRSHMTQGFQFCGIIKDYQPEDTGSGGHAALMVWLNPLYTPAEPPANVDKERRKCA